MQGRQEARCVLLHQSSSISSPSSILEQAPSQLCQLTHCHWDDAVEICAVVQENETLQALNTAVRVPRPVDRSLKVYA